MAKTLTVRTEELELAIRDVVYVTRSLKEESDKFALFQKAINDSDKLLSDRVAGMSTELAVLKQKLDEQSRCSDDQAYAFTALKWMFTMRKQVISVVFVGASVRIGRRNSAITQ